MEIFWYIVLLCMLIIFMVLDGFDFGAGIIHLFIAKEEKDKQSIVKAIGPFWDANEVWLISAGGIMFFAFPTLYASAFSGFYLPLMMILWLLIFRAIGLELRNQFGNKLWQIIWDRAFGLASLFLALFFGLAFGNVIRGVNLGHIIDGVPTYDPQYFFLPLWSPTLNPLDQDLGIIDGFTLLIGLIAVVLLTIHGANWIVLKTQSTINLKLKKLIFRLNIALGVLILSSVIYWYNVNPEHFSNFNNIPFLWILPLVTFGSWIALFWVQKFKKDGMGFLFSSLLLIGGISSTIASLFPNLLISTNGINPSLTIYNSISESYALDVGFNWFIVGIVLVVLYFTIQYKIFKGKMDHIEYGDH